jgi:hypothetical protein
VRGLKLLLFPFIIFFLKKRLNGKRHIKGARTKYECLLDRQSLPIANIKDHFLFIVPTEWKHKIRKELSCFTKKVLNKFMFRINQTNFELVMIDFFIIYYYSFC